MSKNKNKVVPLAEETENFEVSEETPEVSEETVLAEPEEPYTPKEATEYRVYKSLQSGSVSLPIIVKDRFGVETKRYVRFDKHTIRTNDPQEIAQLDAIYEEDKNLPVKNRRVLSVDEFTAQTSPESLYVEIDGEKIHISQVREAVAIAKQNGWTPSETEVVIINNRQSKIIRGGTSAAIGGI